MTARLSSNQYTILRAMDKPMGFDRAVEFNQVMFYSLIRRGLIKLSLTTEQFSRTKDGDAAVDVYANGNWHDLTVTLNPPAREARVSDHLHGKALPKKKPVAKPIKSAKQAA